MNTEDNLEDKYQAQQLNEYMNESLVHWEPVAKEIPNIPDRDKLIAMKEFNSRSK